MVIVVTGFDLDSEKEVRSLSLSIQPNKKGVESESSKCISVVIAFYSKLHFVVLEFCLVRNRTR